MSGAAWAAVAAQKAACLALMREVAAANARVLQRAANGGSWGRMRGEGYNGVCRACHERLQGGAAADAFLDAICAEPDIDTVCKRKWELGEALEAYRAAIDGVAPVPAGHDGLEKLVRRTVTAPDRTPQDLADALARAIATAEGVADAPPAAAAREGGAVPGWFPVAGAAFSAVTVLFLMYLVVAAPPRDESRRAFDILMALCVASASAFLGGTAVARGRLPFFKDAPVQFSAVGGVAVFVVVFLLLRYAA